MTNQESAPEHAPIITVLEKAARRLYQAQEASDRIDRYKARVQFITITQLAAEQSSLTDIDLAAKELASETYQRINQGAKLPTGDFTERAWQNVARWTLRERLKVNDKVVDTSDSLAFAEAIMSGVGVDIVLPESLEKVDS